MTEIDNKTINAWAAGFFDGDGNIYARKQTSSKNFIIRSRIGQVNEPVLEFMKSVFGGNVNKHWHPRNDNCQQMYDWTTHTNNSIKFLNNILPYLIEKHQQAEIAISMKKYIDRRDYKTQRLLSDQISELKHTYEQLPPKSHIYSKTPLKTNDMDIADIAYISGLFDAEGHIGIYGDDIVRIKISNTSKAIIDYLVDTIGGNVYVSKRNPPRIPIADWRLNGISAIDTLKIFRPFLKVKHTQVSIAIKTLSEFRYRKKEAKHAISDLNRGRSTPEKIKCLHTPPQKNIFEYV